MSVALLERAATALGPMLDEATFVGGATIGLWLTDPGAAEARSTVDVDIVTEVATPTAFHAFEARLRERGFREDRDSGILCRWQHGPSDDPLILDAMPTEARLLGFANEWQGKGVAHSQARVLPSGTTIRAISPPYLLATKLEAFAGRGNGDYFASHDLEDLITLVDARESLVDECRSASADLRAFLSAGVGDLLASERFVDAMPAHVRPDLASQQRIALVVEPRLRQLMALMH